jgi:hypothetical protein
VVGHARLMGWVTAKPTGLTVSPALELFFPTFRVIKFLKRVHFPSLGFSFELKNEF